MVNIGAAAGTPVDDKDYRDPIEVPTHLNGLIACQTSDGMVVVVPVLWDYVLLPQWLTALWIKFPRSYRPCQRYPRFDARRPW